MKKTDLLIITALHEEQNAILKEFKNPSKAIRLESIYNYYYELRIENPHISELNVKLTCLSGMGNTNSSGISTNLFHELNPTYCIVFGVAGGLKEKVKLKDIIIPDKIFYYELGKATSDQKIEIRPEIEKTDRLLFNTLNNLSLSPKFENLVKFGDIAVGEKVITDIKLLDSIKQISPKIIGVDMESYGVINSSQLLTKHIRTGVIRVISDYADPNKVDDFREEALANGAEFLKDFLQSEMILNLFREEDNQNTNQKIKVFQLYSLDQRFDDINHIIKKYLDSNYEIVSNTIFDFSSNYKYGKFSIPDNFLTEFTKEISESLSLDKNINSIHCFGLAHIPLLFYFGYVIGRNKITSYITNRQTDEWTYLEKSNQNDIIPINNKFSNPNGLTDYKEVIINFSISAKIHDSQIQEIIDIKNIPIFNLFIDNPQLDIIDSEQQLELYAKKFLDIIQEINNHHPSVEKIHLFMAVPPNLAIKCGQQMSKTMNKKILIYNFSMVDKPKYGWGISIPDNKIFDLRK